MNFPIMDHLAAKPMWLDASFPIIGGTTEAK
jgi:hypothetical protein